MTEIVHDKSVPNVVKSKKDASSPRFKPAIDVSEKTNYENPESIIDVMDSLIRIFDPAYAPNEDVNIGENFNMTNELEFDEPQPKKK